MARRLRKEVTVLTLILVVLAGGLLFSYSVYALPNSSAWRSQESGTIEHLSGVWGSSPSDVFAVGTGGTILRYDGSKWSSMDSGTTCDFESIWGSSPSDIFVVGYDSETKEGAILHYDGSTWYRIDSGIDDTIIDVWGSTSSDVFCVGWLDGVILHYDGSEWSQIYDGLPGGLDGIWGSSSNDIYTVGLAGTVLHYTGAGWNPVSSGTSSNLSDVWGSATDNVFAVGYNGTIIHFDGQAWSLMTSGTTDWLYSVWGSSSDDVFAVGLAGTILHYNGAEWTSISDDTIIPLGIWGTSSSDVFIVGTDGMILHYSGSQSPVITGIAPGKGTQGETLEVIITGTGFIGVNVAFGEGITINSLNVDSEAKITADITISADATVGARDVSVITAGGAGTLTGGFTVQEPGPPYVATVNPNHGRQGETLDVVITGTGFIGADVIFGEDIVINSFTIDSDTQISANITIYTDATVGARNIWVNASGRTGTLTAGFMVEKASDKENGVDINWWWVVAGSCVVAVTVLAIVVYLWRRNR